MPSPEVTDWIRRAAIPVGDLSAFGEALDGVRVVGLGESTHGTAEFFRLKHRLVEYLVTELGYTVFAMEASASAAPAVDAYIRYGKGDAATVLKGLGFWTWRTREVLGLVEWLRAHNAERPVEERVRFVGVDPQRCGASVALVAEVLKDSRDVEALAVLADADPGSRPDPERRLVHAAEWVAAALEERGDPEALRHARILVRAADLVTRPRRHEEFARTVFAARDRYMADAVVEVVESGARVALWGHNGHIAKGRYGGGVESLGTHLRDRYGDAYYALGLVFGEGGFRARRVWPGPWRSKPGKVVANTVGPAPDGTVEAALKAGPETYLLDFRKAAHPVAREWLASPRMTRTYGAVVSRFFYRLNLAPTVPGGEFDGLAYCPVSTPSVPLTC